LVVEAAVPSSYGELLKAYHLIPSIRSGDSDRSYIKRLLEIRFAESWIRRKKKIVLTSRRENNPRSDGIYSLTLYLGDGVNPQRIAKFQAGSRLPFPFSFELRDDEGQLIAWDRYEVGQLVIPTGEELELSVKKDMGGIDFENLRITFLGSGKVIALLKSKTPGGVSVEGRLPLGSRWRSDWFSGEWIINE
jgi:hypothetical protein